MTKNMSLFVFALIALVGALPGIAVAGAAGPYKNSYDGGLKGRWCQKTAGFTQKQYMAGQTTPAQRRAWEACMAKQN